MCSGREDQVGHAQLLDPLESDYSRMVKDGKLRRRQFDELVKIVQDLLDGFVSAFSTLQRHWLVVRGTRLKEAALVGARRVARALLLFLSHSDQAIEITPRVDGIWALTGGI